MRARRIVAFGVLTTWLSVGLASCGRSAREGADTENVALAGAAPAPPAVRTASPPQVDRQVAEPQTVDPQAESPAAEPPPGLTCIQNALGGTRAIAAVSSLWIVADTKPVATSGMRPIPGTREINVVFPDRYKNAHVGRPPGVTTGATLSSIVGFDGDTILSVPRAPDARSSARLRFMREMLMLLPRASAGVTLSQRVVQDEGQERLAIDASGPDDFQATLLADSRTCVPVSLHYALTPQSPVRIDISDYRSFGGIRFPTELTISRRGVPTEQERISRVEVNTPDAARAFAPRG